ncbi:MAG: TolB family protein [Opitutales bacterium]
MERLKLELAEGWNEVDALADAPELLVETEGRLRHVRRDFSEIADFGPVGPVDCPIAYDPACRKAYRYVCEYRPRKRDFSELRAFDLKTGEYQVLMRLPLNQWVLWLLEWFGGAGPEDDGRLFGLLATDVPVEAGITIRHQLFSLDPKTRRPLLRPVSRDAFYPLALSRKRRELLFAGAEGIYILGLKGERLAALTELQRPGGRGGGFDPSGRARVALGGNGLFLWDFEGGGCRRIAPRGQFPAWSPDGRGIWHLQSSSDLYLYDLQTERCHCVVAVRGNRNPELSYARAPLPSPCGRFLALPLTLKFLHGVSGKASVSGERERVYGYRHASCILDLERKEICQTPGFISAFRWLGSHPQ